MGTCVGRRAFLGAHPLTCASVDSNHNTPGLSGPLGPIEDLLFYKSGLW